MTICLESDTLPILMGNRALSHDPEYERFQMTATYTFFESATHKGWLLQVFGTVLPSYWEREAWGDIQGTQIGLRARPMHTETWLLDFSTIGRTNKESQQMFHQRVEEEALAAWAVVERERAEFAAKIRADALAAEEQVRAEEARSRLEASRRSQGADGGTKERVRVRGTTKNGVDTPEETGEAVVKTPSPRKTSAKEVPVKAA